MTGLSVGDAIRARHSTRAFLEKPVSLQQIHAILDVARWAPSGSNIQPWRVHALAGEPLQALTTAVYAAAMAGDAPAPEYVYYAAPLPEPYLSRRRENGWGLYGHLGIAKGDRAASTAQALGNFRFFDAPAGLFFFIDAALAQGSWLDTGMFVQSVMLAAVEHGLATCPQVAWLPYHALIRQHCGIDEGLKLVCGMAIGHADPTAHINAFHTPRNAVDSFLSAAGFADVA